MWCDGESGGAHTSLGGHEAGYMPLGLAPKMLEISVRFLATRL